jgi:subtilisin-like proprotein convertase family protein
LNRNETYTMKTEIMKTILIAGVLLAAAAAQATLFSYSANVGAVIPDGDPAGTASILNVSGTGGAALQDVSVNLDITGINAGSDGFNGDLYGYLVFQPTGGSAATEILLNQVAGSGATATAFGSSASGMTVTLSDSGASSIHTAPGNPVTGTYTPDSANTLDGTFATGGVADGTWTLFLADLSPGGESQLVSWGLNISVVPEPVTWALIAFGAVVATAYAGRQLAGRKADSLLLKED